MLGGLRVFLVVLLALTVGAGGEASAQNAPAIAELELTMLRAATNASVVPVKVEVSSSRAIEATLSLEYQDTNTAWEIPYALAANSEIEQIILVPSGSGGIELQAELVVNGDVVADAEIRDFERAAPVNAIGVLGLDPLVDEAQLVPQVGRASLIDLADLNMLVALDSVVASPAGLRTLTPDELRRLQQWVATGHQLLVADRPGSIDAQLPADWLGDEPVVLADAGVIRYLGDQWESNLAPGVSIATNSQAVVGFFEEDHPELLNDAGFRVPGIGLLALLLLAYLFVAGPIAFVVLNRMKRPTLAWVVVPGLAVVCTAAVFVLGLFLTSGRGNGHATIAEMTSAGATVTESVLLADDGRQELELPAGWTVLSSGLSTTNRSVGAPLTVRPTIGATQLIFDIDPGGGGSAVLTGPAPDLDSGLVVDNVALDGDDLTGTIRNGTGEDLRNVTVFVGGRIVEVDDVPSGGEAGFSATVGGVRPQGLPELRTWGVDRRFGFEFGFDGRPVETDEVSDGPANGSAWIDWRASRLGTAAPDGLVTVVGWTRDVDGQVLGGTGRTAFVARTPVPTSDAPLRSEQVRSLLSLAPDAAFGRFGFDGEVRGNLMVAQYIRPNGGDTSELGLRVRADVEQVRVWTADGWRSFDLPEGGEERIRIPENAWVDNVLWVESSIPQFFGDPGQLDFGLGTAGDNAIEPTLLGAGEVSRRDVFNGFDDPGFNEAVLGSTTPVVLDSDGRFEAEGELFGTFDVWEIDLSEGQSVTVSMNAGGGGFNGPQLDPYLVVRNADGRQVADNDDFNGLDSRLTFAAESAGTYRIETRPLGGSFGSGAYLVTVETDPPDPDETEPEPAAEPEEES
jgi:hypothetical protein